MATEHDGAAGGFLRRQLADGSRAFRYRSRIWTLLGEIESDPFKLALRGPLPMPGFAQRHRQVSRDLNVSDAGAGSQRQVFTREVPPLTRASVAVTPHQPAPQAPCDTAGVIQRAVTVHQVIIPGAVASDPATRLGDSSTYAPAPSEDPQRRDERVQQALSRHEVTIPRMRVSARPSVPLSGNLSLEVEASREPSADSTALPGRVQTPRPVTTGGGAPVKFGSGAIEQVTVGALLPTLGVMPRTLRRLGSTIETQERLAHRLPKPGAVRHDTCDGAAPTEGATPHGIGESSSHAADPLMGSLFPARRANQHPAERSTPRQSRANHYAATEADHRDPPAPALPESPVIVVTQVASNGAGSLAFWERRHLSRLRDRVRR